MQFPLRSLKSFLLPRVIRLFYYYKYILFLLWNKLQRFLKLYYTHSAVIQWTLFYCQE